MVGEGGRGFRSNAPVNGGTLGRTVNAKSTKRPNVASGNSFGLIKHHEEDEFMVGGVGREGGG